MDIHAIIAAYTRGEKTLQETNDALREIGSGLQLVPGKNELSAEDVRSTSVGTSPEQANGFGLLDTGTGSMEKVKVINGMLDHAINEVVDGKPNMLAYCLIGGKRYEVLGNRLTAVE